MTIVVTECECDIRPGVKLLRVDLSNGQMRSTFVLHELVSLEFCPSKRSQINLVPRAFRQARKRPWERGWFPTESVVVLWKLKCASTDLYLAFVR